MRALARGMVFTTAVLLFIAMITAHKVLSHGSGTYFATFMFVPFAMGPAILVWFRPTARSFTMWALCCAFASILYLAGASPYSYERALPYWPLISLCMDGAMFIGFVGSTIMAWTLAARSQPPLADSARARRIRVIAKLAPLVGVTVLALSLLAIERHYEVVAFVFASLIGWTLAPAAYVHRRPTRGTAFMWAAWSLPYSALALVIQLADDDRVPTLARLFMVAAGTLAALLLVVLPLTALRRSEPDGALLPAAVTRR